MKSEPTLTLNKNLWTVPDRMRLKLKFTSVVDLTASSAKDANFIYRPTSIYDVDPAVGGSSMYGYAEWSPFYGRYRVHSSRITVRFLNREAEGADCYILPTNTNPGSNVADPTPYYTHPACHKKTCGSVYGKDTCTIVYNTTTLRMGAVSDFADDNFSATFGSNPTQDWFWFIGVYKGGSLDLVNGITCYVDIESTVDLYDKKVLDTGLFLSSELRKTVSTSSTLPPPPPPPTKVAQPQQKENSAGGFILPNTHRNLNGVLKPGFRSTDS
jgi:hypothetical protein